MRDDKAVYAQSEAVTPSPPQPRRRSGPAVGWAVALWVVAASFLLSGLLFAGLAAMGFLHDARLASHGVTTTATVTDCDLHYDGSYCELIVGGNDFTRQGLREGNRSAGCRPTSSLRGSVVGCSPG